MTYLPKGLPSLVIISAADSEWYERDESGGPKIELDGGDDRSPTGRECGRVSTSLPTPGSM